MKIEIIFTYLNILICSQATKVQRASSYSSALSLTSAIDGVAGQRHAQATLPPEKTRYRSYRRMGGYQGRYGRVLKISLTPDFDPRTVQPVASRYTDWVVSARSALVLHCKCRRWIKLARVCVQWRTTNVSCLFNTDFTCSDCVSSVTVRMVQKEAGLSLKLYRSTEEKQNSVTVINMSKKIRNQYLRAICSTSHIWCTSKRAHFV
jgi:hypothetical protein